jgi:hypothetical protein
LPQSISREVLPISSIAGGGEGLSSWQVAGGALIACASYWTPADAHCCPLRDYGFTVRAQHGYLLETRDERPWLGVTVHEVDGAGAMSGPLQVTELADRSPAAGHLQFGDVIGGVLNSPPPPKQSDPAAVASIFDKLNLLAGDVAKLLVSHNGSQIVVSVPLGSMKDSYGQPLPANDFTIEAL